MAEMGGRWGRKAAELLLRFDSCPHFRPPEATINKGPMSSSEGEDPTSCCSHQTLLGALPWSWVPSLIT